MDMGRSFQIGHDIGILSALFEKKSVLKYKNTDRETTGKGAGLRKKNCGSEESV